MKILDLGVKDYTEVWNLQKDLLEKRISNQIDDTLILVEHSPIYTVGRGSRVHDTSLAGVPVVEIERGGKMTFHGPGQLVGYPIFRLDHRDLRRYLRNLEQTLVCVVKRVAGLQARPSPESLVLEPDQLQTGVWIGDRKIASIGIAVRHWVAYHGFALNISTDLKYFQAIEPCGFHGSVMTSVERELREKGKAPDMAAMWKKAKEVLIKGFLISPVTLDTKDSLEKVHEPRQVLSD